LEVEAIERLDAGLEQVVTVQILERQPHPQADRLSLCKVSKGEGEPLDIVCGAQNMKAGDRVALAQIGAVLPNGLKIQQSKIRGVVSNGMLCSDEELGFASSSDGILILPADTPLGRPLAEVLGRKDTILTLKLTANRGDCLSHYGLAREVAAALGVQPKRPEASLLKLEGSLISVHLDAVEAAGGSEPCPQFYGCLVEGVQIAPSPDWIVRRLESLGLRSINNVVDATNLVLLELGHPVHAYDADRLEGNQIHVRMAREGEVLPLLDGQSVTLAGTELVIADGVQGQRAIGLAGVMGGGNSEVQPGTKRLFLECAEFEPRLVRRAASRHQRHTEAAHRFERGIDSAALSQVISRLASLIQQLAGAKVVGAVVAKTKQCAAVSADAAKYGKKISVQPSFFGGFLGMDVTAEQAEKILTGLGCRISKGKGVDQEWEVESPSYRRDLTIPADLAEEVARTIGYDAIRETVPALTTTPQPGAMGLSGANVQLNAAKDALAGFGLHETVNFAFTSRSWLDRFQMTSSAKVMNPLSEEHEALVPSLLPGLVRNALENWNKHFGSEPLPIRLFELRPTFSAKGAIAAQGEMETGVEERWKLAIALSGPRFAGGLRQELGEVDFYDLKGIVEGLFASLGTKGIRLQPLTVGGQVGGASVTGLFHPGQTAEILAGRGEVVGYMGLVHPKISQELKVRGALWLAEIDWEMIRKLSRAPGQGAAFKQWSEFPSIERDFALLVREDVSADKITQLALKAGKPLAKVAKIFDVYRGSQVAKGMTSVAVRVIFYDESRSLQESEAEAASSQILNLWKKELGAELRS
jgi:phenylalanyl-tRNA synthetase beta chain